MGDMTSQLHAQHPKGIIEIGEPVNVQTTVKQHRTRLMIRMAIPQLTMCSS